jgi:hypothetical protein
MANMHSRFRGQKFDKTQKRFDLGTVLSQVARGEGSITWTIPPAKSNQELCEASIRALLECGGTPENVSERVPGLKLSRCKFRKIILRHEDALQQTYFKIFLPGLSLTWRRGLKCFMPPALREARSMTMAQSIGIDTVELVGVAILPWASRLGVVQDISVLITRSPIETQPVCTLIDSGKLSLEQRMNVARRIIEYAHCCPVVGS